MGHTVLGSVPFELGDQGYTHSGLCGLRALSFWSAEDRLGTCADARQHPSWIHTIDQSWLFVTWIVLVTN